MDDDARCHHRIREDVPELYYSLADRLASVMSRLAVGGPPRPVPDEVPLLPVDDRPSLSSRERRQLQDNLRGSMAVLSHLVASGGEATATELREATGLSGARVSNICTALEEKGLIERSHRHKDRRKVTIALTATGREFAEDKMDFVRGVVADFLWDLGEEDSRELVRILDRMLDVIEQRHGASAAEALASQQSEEDHQ